MVVAREVTKVYEEFLRGSASELLSRLKKRPIKGEITVLLAPQLKANGRPGGNESIRREVQEVMSAQGLSERAA